MWKQVNKHKHGLFPSLVKIEFIAPLRIRKLRDDIQELSPIIPSRWSIRLLLEQQDRIQQQDQKHLVYPDYCCWLLTCRQNWFLSEHLCIKTLLSEHSSAAEERQQLKRQPLPSPFITTTQDGIPVLRGEFSQLIHTFPFHQTSLPVPAQYMSSLDSGKDEKGH